MAVVRFDPDKKISLLSDVESQRPKPLNHLKIFNPQELKKLIQRLKLDSEDPQVPQQLERLLENQLPRVRRLYRVGFKGARYINGLYFPFSFSLSGASVQPIADFLQLGVIVPSPVAWAIGGTISAASTVYWIFSFDDDKAAIRARLEYELRKPIQERAKELVLSPKNGFMIVTDHSIYLIMTMNSMNTLFISIPPFANLHWALKTGIFCGVQFFGHFFYDEYTRKQYKEDSLKFWFDKNTPWIPGEIYRLNIIAAIQAMLAFLGVVGLQGFPMVPKIAVQSASALGFWINPYIMIPLAVIYFSRVYYPSTYHELFGPKIQAKELIIQKLNHAEFLRDAIADLKEAGITDPQKIQTKMLQRLHERADDKLKLWEDKIDKDEKWFYTLRHDRSTLTSLGLRAVVGGLFGNYLLSPLIGFGGPVLGAFVLVSITYQGKKIIMRDILVCQRVAEEKPQQEAEEKSDCVQRCKEITSEGTAQFVNFANGAANTMTTTGAGAQILGNASPWSMMLIISMALESGLNIMKYGINGARDSISSCFSARKKQTQTSGTLFNQVQIQPHRAREANTARVARGLN